MKCPKCLSEDTYGRDQDWICHSCLCHWSPWQQDEIERLRAENVRLGIKLSGAEADLEKLRKYYHQPSHGPCCTCQHCGNDYDSCRCDLDEVADECERLKTENSRLSDEWQKCHDWNGQLVAEHYSLQKGLRKLEFAGRESSDRFDIGCPICHQTRLCGHKSDCWLKELLK